MTSDTETASFRILLVDDNPSIHEDFRKILCPDRSQSSLLLEQMVEEIFGDAPRTQSGGQFDVDSAFQGQEALAKVQAAETEGRPYSLAFMDVRMPPGWDGIETIKHIWMEYPHIQIVICTAYADYSWNEILQNLGKTDSLVILKKPFDNVEVLQLAHTLTQKWVVTRKANARMADLDEMVRQRTKELLEANHQLQDEIKCRSEIESALRESEERFHKAFETVAVPVAILALDTGEFVDANRSFLELAGHGKESVLGSTPARLDLLVDPAQYGGILENLNHGQKVRNVELAIRRRGGEIRQTLASIELLKLGAQACLLAALQDVTEQRSLESQLRQAQKMEAVGQLAAGVAHDFNNLLTVIHGYATLQLAKQSLEADIAKAFHQVKAASERAAALTRQLLTFSRRQIVKRQPLDVGATLSKLKGMLIRTLGEGIQFDCDLASELPLVNADESNLDQVFMNLAVNARDAMPNGGRLCFSTGLATISSAEAEANPKLKPGTFVRVTVSDTGCGMDAHTLERIFEPFFTTKPPGQGTGLGLSTVYGIIEQHDGWIQVESQIGKGTTFCAFLPALPRSRGADRATVEKAEERARTPRARLPETILVVEDQAEVRDFIASTLTQEGYDVLEADSGADALSKWASRSGAIRLLLTDMVMPGGMSGAVLAKQLLQLEPDLRVVYTSGYSPDILNNAAGFQAGWNFLSKPFTHSQLLAAVDEALAPAEPTSQLVPANS